MNELDKMKRAHMYMTKLSEGINPLDDMEMPEDTLLNNIRICRCFSYVSDILRQVIENGGEVTRQGQRANKTFEINAEEIEKIIPSNEPLTITKLCELISQVRPNQKKLYYGIVTDWLVEKGFLSVEIVNGKSRKRVTQEGIKIGIKEEFKESSDRPSYYAIFYTTEAQQFIINNLLHIIS